MNFHPGHFAIVFQSLTVQMRNMSYATMDSQLLQDSGVLRDMVAIGKRFLLGN